VKNILILGASGLVGSNCLRQWQDHAGGKDSWNVVGTYFSYAAEGTVYYDTLNPENPQNFDVKAFKPDWIVHCGALTHVDYCEEHPDESYRQTVQSTRNAIALAKQLGARMVYISTDYVFDGQDGPYSEDDAVHPLSVYARHKLEAEEAVRTEVPGSLVVRITNVYGTEERNKNFVSRLAERMIAGEEFELRLPYDQYATPVNACDVARALELLMADGKHGVYHIAGTDLMNRCQLAARIQRYFPQGKMRIVPTATAQLKQPAARPLMGGLLAEKFLAEYPDFRFSNVDDFLRALALTPAPLAAN
jgi:dTDP-4-dehydrorhamnose reductase